MLNILLPMAGVGSRFRNAGYTTPKPLLNIHGVPMVKVVVDNLTPTREHRFIFVCQEAHIKEYNLIQQLTSYATHVEVISVSHVTEGQACTALLAKEYINTDEPLLIANIDQYIDIDINLYLEAVDEQSLDGMIMTMYSQDSKWSYAHVDDEGFVTRTAEKEVISPHAAVGIFTFRHGSDFVQATERMLEDDMRVNNEFYICPCYNYLIHDGKRIGIYSIGNEYENMYGLGIPEDLEFFINNPISMRVK